MTTAKWVFGTNTMNDEWCENVLKHKKKTYKIKMKYMYMRRKWHSMRMREAQMTLRIEREKANVEKSLFSTLPCLKHSRIEHCKRLLKRKHSPFAKDTKRTERNGWTGTLNIQFHTVIFQKQRKNDHRKTIEEKSFRRNGFKFMRKYQMLNSL